MKQLLYLALIIILFIVCVNSIEKPKTIVLPAVIYDQHPIFNPSFEPRTGKLTTGLVFEHLNPLTRKPELNSLSVSNSKNIEGRVEYPSLFRYFFTPNKLDGRVYVNGLTKNSGFNYPIDFNLTLTYNEKSGVYEYSNTSFFPIDYKGFDSLPLPLMKYRDIQTWEYHNYHFTLHVSTKFTYQGGEIFRFNGDDDVWVFIDNRLAVDLGGLHEPADASISLDKFGLVRGESYNFDFFYCERHTSKSTIKISSTILLFCPVKDYCGVCNGDGSTCCDAKRDCDDNNECTVDLCPSVGELKEIPKGPNGFKEFCKHKPIANPLLNDKCNSRVCNISTGEWVINSTTVCKVDLDNCEESIGCDFNFGCQKKSTCIDLDNKCISGKCQMGLCLLKNKTDCVQELETISGEEDLCYNYSCVGSTGCRKEPKCPVSLNPCINVTCSDGKCKREVMTNDNCCKDKCVLNKCQKGQCNKADGSCTAIDLETIDDGNKCTIDSCDPITGLITHTAVICTGCSKCSQNTGKCIQEDMLCDDLNQCSTDICTLSNSFHGICSNKESSHCNGSNKCKVYTCDSIKGCNSTDKVCPDNGKCQIGYCDEKVGCLVKPKECRSNAFCLVSECDELYGCITYDKRCVSEDSKCQAGVCINATSSEEGRCISVPYDPKPFICNKTAVISTAVVASIALAGVIVLAIIFFAGKKGYDYYKEHQFNKMTSTHENPLYEAKNPYNSENPLYTFK